MASTKTAKLAAHALHMMPETMPARYRLRSSGGLQTVPSLAASKAEGLLPSLTSSLVLPTNPILATSTIPPERSSKLRSSTQLVADKKPSGPITKTRRSAKRNRLTRQNPLQTNTGRAPPVVTRSEEHTSELQSPLNLVCRL